jgi:hypothetical protein
MEITGFSEYLFWSYNKEADLPEEVIITQILLYGEIKDMLRLVKLISREKIEKVISSASINHQNIKWLNFFQKVIFS